MEHHKTNVVAGVGCSIGKIIADKQQEYAGPKVVQALTY